MHYHAYELAHALLSPWRLGAEAMKAGAEHPLNPFAATPAARSIAAACEVFEKVTRRYGKPAWDLPETWHRGRRVPVREEALLTKPFCTLRRFTGEVERSIAGHPLPQVLLVAPMSGHYATLLRGTISALVAEHDVIVTDWADARDVPIVAGRFGLEEFVDDLLDFIRYVGPQTHVVAVSQSSVPALAATAILAADGDACTPASLTLLSGPLDTRINPTAVNRLVESRPLEWFDRHVTSLVPLPHVGAMRRVYPGFLQLTGFMTMDLDQHMSAHADLFNDLIRGDRDSVRQHREFYEDYMAVMDLTAEFFLDTVRHVFQEHALANGTLTHRGRVVDTGAICETALFTIEAERDVICGAGQTHAAHDLCPRLPVALKSRYDLPGTGHFGLFNGARWRTEVAPRVATFIRKGDEAVAARAAAREASNVVRLPSAR